MTRVTNLRDWIDKQPVMLGRSWLDAQEPRKQKEADYHDDYRAGHRNEQGNEFPNQRFYEAASAVDQYVDAWIRRNTAASEHTFLDYACGHGIQAIRAAKAGAGLAVGIDISETSVRNAAENARKHGLSDRVRSLQRDCEDSGFPPSSFTRGVCISMLHHLDIDRAYTELARIMAPGARILCVEALAYNPFIQAYRDRTPELRTEWEKKHIIGLREVRLAGRWFYAENMKFFMMAAPLAALLPAGKARRLAMKVGHTMDAVLTRLPFVKLWSWQFSFELVRKADA